MTVIYNIIEFLISFVETYVCYLFLDLMLKKRIHSRKKDFIVLVYSLGVTTFIFWNNQISLFSNFLLVFVIFAIGVSVPLLFITSFPKAITIVGLYYLTISLFDLFFIFIISIIINKNNIGDYLLGNQSIYRCIYICIVKICLVISYLIIKRININYEMFSRFWLFWLIICIVGYIALFYFQQFAIGPLTQILASNWIIFLVVFAMILLLFYMYIKYRDYKEKNMVINIRNDLLEKSYENIQRIYKDNEHVMHDFKNHLAIISNYIERSENSKALEYIENIVQSFRKIENTVWSEIEIVDIILNCKISEAEANHIKMDIDVMVAPSKVSDVDFCTILSNLLDNAIEAAVKDVEENRYIKLTMKSINNMLSIKVINNTIDKPQIAESLKFETTKKNKKGHGIGLESVEYCINKYNGIINFNFEMNYFEIQILLMSV